MFKIATIQKYIESCDRIINNSKEPNEAKELENEIVSVLGNDIRIYAMDFLDICNAAFMEMKLKILILTILEIFGF